MGSADFIHLHNHTMYSLLDGAIKIPDLLKAAAEMEMNSLAITDHGNLFGAIDFYQQAKKHRIKPIIGIETYIVPHDLHDKRPVPGVPDSGYHLILLAKNLTGYKNLMELSSIAFLEGFYFKPRIDKKVLAQHSEGLIALSACLKGEVAQAAVKGDDDKIESVVRSYLDIFDTEDFYLEIQDHNLDEELTVRAAMKKNAEKFGLGLIATNDCHYLKKEHSAAHDALLCLQTGKVVSDTERMRYNTEELYLKTPAQMKELFADTPSAIENSLKIAERCNLELKFKNRMPAFPLPDKFKNDDEYIEYLTYEGLKQRYGEVTDELKKRLDYELSIIKQMGYSGYFLIVRDFIVFARDNEIPVGPGRGSAAGSLVSYSLGITNIDPMKYNLLFERFLNPERVSMPDIDIDFADRGRDRVIEYVTDKYGQENVAQIITFGTMAARAVVRDVGRVLSVPYGDMDRVAKTIPEEIGMTLEKALDISADLKDLKNNDESIAKVLEYSIVLEGLARHSSTHAAGVVIAPKALTNYVPLYKSNKDEITTQFDMRCVDTIGLLKMDFLGLRTLTVIDDAIRLIKKTQDVDIIIDDIPLDDPDVYKLFAAGRTIGIFQFESSGMREYLRKLGPTCIDDLIAMNALYRPGPLDSGMIDTYIDCKRGRKKMKFPHPVLEPILKDTYGVIVFQEQVLKIAQDMAGYSLGKADILRKAIGKKQAEIMAQQKSEFIEGAVKKKVDKKIAEQVFDMIETFARYGFVKAHATGYAVVAYQTAYLKAHYQAEFIAAALTSEMGNSNRVTAFKNECKELGIELLPPDINEGFSYFTVVDGQIVFGLAAVKNVGISAVEAVVEAREDGGKFTDIADFCKRADLRVVNKKALESLIAAGAFDSIDSNRAKLFHNVENLASYGISVQKEAQSGQSSLFGEVAQAEIMKPNLEECKPWSDTETRETEKKVLGFYLSSHPLEDNRLEYNTYINIKLEELIDLKDDSNLIVGGVINECKIKISQKNKQYAFITIEDFTDFIEVLVFSDVIEKRKLLLEEGNNIFVAGVLSTKEGEKPKIIANDIFLMKTAHLEIPGKFHIFLSESSLEDDKINDLDKILIQHSGKSEIIFHFRDDQSELQSMSGKYKIQPSPELLDTLAQRFGENCFKYEIAKGFANGNSRGGRWKKQT
ncbi:MAG: DNA polymerase III subunit alpha [candidate division Zixibacteria bacterium]|nr:DNA polymerase III subunit alpha [candidate division Zixibacteria bacterium]